MAYFGSGKKCKNLNSVRDDCLKEEDTFGEQGKDPTDFSTAKRGKDSNRS